MIQNRQQTEVARWKIMLHEFSDFVTYINQIQEGEREKGRGGETTYNYQIKLCLEKNVLSCFFQNKG